MSTREPSPLLKLFLDLGPLVVFFSTFKFGRELLENPTIHGLMAPLTGAKALAGQSGPLFLATACFIVVSIAALIGWLCLGETVGRTRAALMIVIALGAVQVEFG